MPLRAVFLDIGNTLLDEVHPRFEVYASAATSRGVEVDAARMRTLMAAAHRELPDWVEGGYRYSDPWFEAFIARVFGGALGFAPADVEAITAELFARFESPETFRPFPGAEELLDASRAAGLVVGVISNWSARLDRVLQATGLFDRFDFVLSSAIEGVQKPDPEIFRRALERAGVAAEEALHAGDHPELDVAAARALGLDAVLVDHADVHSALDVTRVRELAELQRIVLERAR